MNKGNQWFFILWYWLPVILYAGLITYLSSLSFSDVESPSFFWGYDDKVIHAIEYSLLAILCYRVYRYALGPSFEPYAPLLAIVTAILFGVSDEIHQYFVPLRYSDVWDVVADGVGASIGVGIWHSFESRMNSVFPG